jgi:hypothetical protein
MANICKLCAHPDQDTVKAAFASGATDRELARQFGVSHMAIGRHRRAHIVGPLKAAIAALDKGRTERERRAEQLAAIEAGDPSVFISLAGIVQDLRRTFERLERVASGAEQDNHPLAMATLSGQLVRAIETRAKLGSVGGYAPRREDAGAPAVFHLSINLPGGEQPLVIDAAVPAGGEADADEVPLIGAGAGTPGVP